MSLSEFFAAIRDRKDRETNLVVFSSKTGALRCVKITPREWGGKGLLGSTIRFDAYDSQEYRDIRVTHVFENSPAEMAGIAAYLLPTILYTLFVIDDRCRIVHHAIQENHQASFFLLFSGREND